MPEGWETIYTLACLGMMLGFVVFAVRVWRRERDPIPALCLVGGAVCVFFEPVVDVLGLCWYPRVGQHTLFETFGRPIPVLTVFGYTWFMGGLSALVYRRTLEGGVRAAVVMYPVFMVLYLPFELVAVQTGVYVYYGHQPLRVLDFPAWWAFVNCATPVIAGYVLANVRPLLRGWRVLAVLVIVPLFDGAVQGATAWPVWNAINGDAPGVIVQGAGILTAGLATALVWVVTRLTLRPDLALGEPRCPSTPLTSSESLEP